MNRRGFLKLAAMATAVAVVPSLALSQNQKHKDVSLITKESRVDFGDLILEHVDTLRHIYDFSDIGYRGIAHMRQDPNNKKYFHFSIDSLADLNTKKCQDDIYNHLISAFIHNDEPKYMGNDPSCRIKL